MIDYFQTVLMYKQSFAAFVWFLALSFLAALIISVPSGAVRSKVFKKIQVTISIFLVGNMGYWYWGAWSEWGHHQYQLEKQQSIQALLKSNDNPAIWIKKLKLKLEAHPNSAKGWYLLGRLYASQSDWEDARFAFAKAKQLQPNHIPIIVNYAQSLWQLNHQKFNDETRNLFREVLKQKPEQPDALAMLAMDAFLRHSYKSAIDYWQQLLNIVPPQSDDAKAIHQAIAKAELLRS